MKKAWSDSTWTYYPDLTLVAARIHASSREIDNCEFERRYGPNHVKEPYQADYTPHAPYDLSGWWVKVSKVGDQSLFKTMFMGRVETPSTVLMGDAANPTGKQSWAATGGLRLLEKIIVSQAVFYDFDSDTYNTVGWVPPMNKRDEPRVVSVGNAIVDGSGAVFYGER